MFELQKELAKEVEEKISANQRKYFLNEQLKQIERNFEAKQSLFSNLQKLPDSELEKLYHSGELKDVK